MGETTLGIKICSSIIQCSNPGKEPPSDELTSEQERVKIDIDDKIRRELPHFPRLYFLEHAFEDYFKQLFKKKAPKLLNKLHIRFYEYFTVGYYTKELAKLRREREDQDSILKCIEDI